MAQRGKEKVNLSDFFDEEIKEELKREIKDELKKELKKELREDVLKEEAEKELSEKPAEKKIQKKKKSYVRILVFLVILIMVLDLVSLYFYYKPNLNLNFISSIKSKMNSASPDISSSANKCKDGTMYDQCSKDKPYYCYNGELLKKAYTCGCPSGYKVDFQDCRKT